MQKFLKGIKTLLLLGFMLFSVTNHVSLAATSQRRTEVTFVDGGSTTESSKEEPTQSQPSDSKPGESVVKPEGPSLKLPATSEKVTQGAKWLGHVLIASSLLLAGYCQKQKVIS